jgi:hypothetical protein
LIALAAIVISTVRDLATDIPKVHDSTIAIAAVRRRAMVTKDVGA